MVLLVADRKCPGGRSRSGSYGLALRIHRVYRSSERRAAIGASAVRLVPVAVSTDSETTDPGNALFSQRYDTLRPLR